LTEVLGKLKTENNEPPQSKKFVFQVNTENIDFVERLSYQEKNDLINYLIKNYRFANASQKKKTEESAFIKKCVIIFLAITVGLPLIIYLTGLSFSLTKTNYTYMQKNFEKLF